LIRCSNSCGRIGGLRKSGRGFRRAPGEISALPPRAAALAGPAITPLRASAVIAGMRILDVEAGHLAQGPSRPTI
jgi:hypothetical protein